MPVTYPRGMPPFNIRSGTITLGRQVVGNPLRSGQIERIEVGEPRWSVTYTSVTMFNAAYRDACSWWDSLQGGMKTFLAVPPDGRFPIAFPAGFTGVNRAGGGAFDGTSRLAGFGATNDLLTFGSATGQSLPANFTLANGDYIGLSYQNRYSLHRVIEARTASAGGVMTQIQVTPFVRSTLFPGGNLVTVTVASPAFEALIDPESWSGEALPEGSVISFAAVQRGY
jgi:hypothetical protein